MSERVDEFELRKRGGDWLAAARKWLQHRRTTKGIHGDQITWGDSSARFELGADTIEELASIVAAAAMNEQSRRADVAISDIHGVGPCGHAWKERAERAEKINAEYADARKWDLEALKNRLQRHEAAERERDEARADCTAAEKATHEQAKMLRERDRRIADLTTRADAAERAMALMAVHDSDGNEYAHVVMLKGRIAELEAALREAKKACGCDRVTPRVMSPCTPCDIIDAALSATASPTPDFGIASIVGQLREIVTDQANDPGLWYDADHAPEAYLQRALRDLHGVVKRAIAGLSTTQTVVVHRGAQPATAAKCKLCGVRSDAFGCYDTCTAEGPHHEWSTLDLPDDIQAALRDPDVELPGEQGALRKAMAWMGVLPADQFAWDPAKASTDTPSAAPSSLAASVGELQDPDGTHGRERMIEKLTGHRPTAAPPSPAAREAHEATCVECTKNGRTRVAGHDGEHLPALCPTPRDRAESLACRLGFSHENHAIQVVADEITAAIAVISSTHNASWWWSTICSAHRVPQPQTCRLCRSGYWLCKEHNVSGCEKCGTAREGRRG